MVRAARCDSCRFWQPEEAGERGECRVRAPQVIVVEVYPSTAWPTTEGHMWCGEWQEAYRKKAGELMEVK